MAVRWRLSGELVCAAKSKARKGDTYIDDTLHYELSVTQKVLIADKDEERNGQWHWLHGDRGVFVRSE